MSGKNACSVDGCESQIRRKLSFFKCPMDQRCQTWKNALGFTGSHKYANMPPEECHSLIRICALHFDEKCFTNATRTRIHSYSVPSLRLPTSTGKGDGTNQTIPDFVEFEDYEQLLQKNTIKRESEDTEDGMIPYMQQIEPHRKKQHLSDTLPATVDPLFIEIYADPGTSETPAPTVPSTSTVVTPYLYSTIETQTPKSFLLEIPQRRKYNRKIRKLQGKVSQLQKRLKEATGEDDDSDDDLSDEDDLQMFELLCDKYLTSSMSEFVKMQAKRGQQGGKCEDKFGDVFILYGT